MSFLTRLFFLAIVLLIAGGLWFLASWDIPAPVEPVEKVIPNARVLR